MKITLNMRYHELFTLLYKNKLPIQMHLQQNSFKNIFIVKYLSNGTQILFQVFNNNIPTNVSMF